MVEADGSVRTGAVRGIVSGWKPSERAEDPYAVSQRIPGLAVSPDGTRAVVVPADDRVAEVELDTLRVSYHQLSEHISLFRRLWDWLQPEAAAKSVAGYDRLARWLGQDHVAVAGTNYGGPGADEAARFGLRLIDTRHWSVRTLTKQAAGMVVVRDLVLAFAWAGSGGGTGLRVYDAEGEQLFHLLGNTPVDWVEAAPPYAYVAREGGRRFDLVDLRSGRVVGRPRPKISVSVVAP